MKYTIVDLSNITGISQRTISRIETGENNVNYETIITLLKALNLYDVICDSIKNSIYLTNKLRVRKK